MQSVLARVPFCLCCHSAKNRNTAQKRRIYGIFEGMKLYQSRRGFVKGENDALRSELKDFRFLRKVLGSQQIDSLITQAKDIEQQRKQIQRTRRRNTNYER